MEFNKEIEEEFIIYNVVIIHPAGRINQYTPPRVCVTPPSLA